MVRQGKLLVGLLLVGAALLLGWSVQGSKQQGAGASNHQELSRLKAEHAKQARQLHDEIAKTERLQQEVDTLKSLKQLEKIDPQQPTAEGLWGGTHCERHELAQHQFQSIEQVLQKSGRGAARKGSKGGEWTASTHLNIYGMNLAVFFLRFLAFHVKPATVMEFGCGLGTTADFLARYTPGGSRVTCIEPQPMLKEVFGKNPLPHRATQLAVNLFQGESKGCAEALVDRGFELVLSVEVAEHIPLEHHQQMIHTLAKATRKLLIFSAARKEQGGTGHIASSSFSAKEWIAKFEAAGLVYLPNLTRMARMSARPERAFDLMGNLIVMRAAQVTDPVLLNDVSDEADLIFHNKIFPFRVTEWRIKTEDPRFNGIAQGGFLSLSGDHEPKKVFAEAGHNWPEDKAKEALGEIPCFQCSPTRRDEFIAGYTAALFPELDLLKRRMARGESLCA